MTSAGAQPTRVSFDSEGAELVGDLYLPPAGERLPGLVVTGSWTTVKEQMAGRTPAASPSAASPRWRSTSAGCTTPTSCATSTAARTASASASRPATPPRKSYEQTGEVDYVPAISTTDDRAAMVGEFDYYRNPQRGAIPEWPNRFAVMSARHGSARDRQPTVLATGSRRGRSNRCRIPARATAAIRMSHNAFGDRCFRDERWRAGTRE